MRNDHTYRDNVFNPIVHDFLTMWKPIRGEANHARYLANRKSANAKAQTAKARAAK